MNTKDIPVEYRLIVLTWLKYEAKASADEGYKEFIDSHFANHIKTYFVKSTIHNKGTNVREPGLTTITNSFIEIRKREDFTKFRGIVAAALSQYCGYIDYKDFVKRGPEVKDIQKTIENNYLESEKITVLPLSDCIRILNGLEFKLNKKSETSEVAEKDPHLPENWLESKFCTDLEQNTKNIGVYVITSNLDWAYNHRLGIFDSLKNNNTHFRYLLTNEHVKHRSKLQESVTKNALDERLKMVSIFEDAKKEIYGIKIGQPLFLSFMEIAFPSAGDLVMYVGVPDEAANNYPQYKFRNDEGRNVMLILGTSPYGYHKADNKVNPVAIDIETAQEIYEWFIKVWEMLTEEKLTDEKFWND